MDFASLINKVESPQPQQQLDYSKLIDKVEQPQSVLAGGNGGVSEDIKFQDQTTKPTVNPDGTISTLTTGQPEDKIGAFSKDVVKPLEDKAMQSLAGLRRDYSLPLTKTILDTFGIKSHTDEDLTKINSYIDSYNKEHPEETIHPSTAASLALTFGLPWGNTKKSIGAMSGALAYLEGLGTTQDYGDAIAQGALGIAVGAAAKGTLDLITNKLLGKINDKGSEELLNYIVKQYNVKPEDLSSIYEKWGKINKFNNNYQDKVKAVVDSLGDTGAIAKTEAATSSPTATRQVTGAMKDRMNLVKDLSKSDASLEDISSETQAKAKIVKDNYNKLKTKIGDKEVVTEDVTIPEALDDATTGQVAEIRKLLKAETTTVNDLTDSMPIINDMLRKTKGKTNFEWSQLKTAVETKLKDTLSANDYNRWLGVNEDYAKMSQSLNSDIGKILQRVKGKLKGKESITADEALRKISRMTVGEDTFSNLKFLIGSKHAAELEKMIINEAMGKGSEEVTWATLARNLDKHGFVTKEGKQLAKLVEHMRDSFATDDKLRDIWFRNTGLSAGMSDSIIAKIRYSLVGRAFDILVKHIPFNETSRHIRMMDDLADVLSSPTKLAKFEKQISNLSEGVKEKIFNDVLKQIEFKPDAKTTGNVNLKPKYVTSKGTTADHPTPPAMKDAQDDLISKFIAEAKPVADDKIIRQAFDIANKRNYERSVKAMTHKLKVGQLKANARHVANKIKSEADILIKQVQKDSGVKLSPEDAQKIIRHKFDELLKDCK